MLLVSKGIIFLLFLVLSLSVFVRIITKANCISAICYPLTSNIVYVYMIFNANPHIVFLKDFELNENVAL